MSSTPRQITDRERAVFRLGVTYARGAGAWNPLVVDSDDLVDEIIAANLGSRS